MNNHTGGVVLVQNDLFFDSENDYVDYQVKYWREVFLITEKKIIR